MARANSRIYRVLLHAAWYFVAKRLPVSNHRLGGRLSKEVRVWICRRLFAACGTECNIERGVSFGGGQGIRMGDYSDLGINAEIHGEATFGNYVMMGPHVLIFTGNHKHDRTDIPMMRQGHEPVRAVTVGDDVWIGARVTILAGVAIGQGAIIGAGAVLFNDVPPWAVVVGNPARVVQYRKPPQAKSEAKSEAKPQAG
jgi:maltose O-acetyltransferase